MAANKVLYSNLLDYGKEFLNFGFSGFFRGLCGKNAMSVVIINNILLKKQFFFYFFFKDVN